MRFPNTEERALHVKHDSSYVMYGYDEFFNDVNELPDERENGLSDDELYDVEWGIRRVDSMEEAMKRLDQAGMFGRGRGRLIGRFFDENRNGL